MTKTQKSYAILLIKMISLLVLLFVAVVMINHYSTKKQKESSSNIVNIGKETLLKGTIAENPQLYSGTGGYVKIKVSYNKVSATDDTKIDCFIFHNPSVEMLNYRRNHSVYMQIGDSVTFRKIDVAYKFPSPLSEEHQSSFGLIVKIKDIVY